jgi:pimeloyl-ACP methyl ester carboxylesterase
MNRKAIHLFENTLRMRNRLIGVGWHKDPLRHFGPGGVEEAELHCAEANRDLLSFLRPPADARAAGLSTRPVRGAYPIRGSVEISFDSPLPSGRPKNDRVVARIVPARVPRKDGAAIVFHHAFLQRRWSLWSWFVAPLTHRYPVVILAAPYHFERTPPDEFPGEGTINPNPWRLYEAIRQWCWDQQALMNALPKAVGLEPIAVMGFSLGAFQTLLVAAAGALAGYPLLSVACTNRYAWGLEHGVLGRGTFEGMKRIGIDRRRLGRMVGAMQLERHVGAVDGDRVLYIAGRHDLVDPPPSGKRLESALRPAHSVWLEAGHGSLVLERERIGREALDFLDARL